MIPPYCSTLHCNTSWMSILGIVELENLLPDTKAGKYAVQHIFVGDLSGYGA